MTNLTSSSNHPTELITIKKYATALPTALANSCNPYIATATSDNTRKAYQQDVRHFLKWGGVLPTSPQELVRYLIAHAETLNSRTLARRLVALRNWHRYQGFEDPTVNPTVQKTLKGIFNTHGKPKAKAPALSLAHLKVITDYLKQQNNNKALRDRALLLIQFFGAFRVSELVKIEYEHLAWLAEGVEILIPKSKTDQIQQGQRVFIPHSDNALCPVTALKEWLALSKISSGFIFKSLTKNQQVKHAKETPLPTRNVHTLIKQIAKACGLSFEGKSYSTHSLRSGLATTASRNNASIKSIMRQGRWRNINTVLGYIEDGQRIDDNAAQHILSRTPSFQNT